MTRILKHGVSALLAAAMLLSGIGALAYNTADFGDVPENHWAYADIMEVADKGVIKGTGGGKFSPEDKLTVGAFLALVGRSMYPADCKETAVWWEVYYTLAAQKGIILATEYVGLASAMDKEITRNEMARILIRADEAINGNAAVNADTTKIPDYATIPAEYQSFAAQAYAKGLLTGVDGGLFAGGKTLTRAEAAAVIKRLIAAGVKGLLPVPEGKEDFRLNTSSVVLDNSHESEHVAAYSIVGELTWTVSEEGIVKITPSSSRGCAIVAIASGTVTVTATDEAGRSATCTVTSTYVKPESPTELTGWVETLNVKVNTFFADTREDGPAGVTVVLYYKSGEEIGRTVTGEDGRGVITFDLDKAYYTEDHTAIDFYALATYIDQDGNHYSNILVSGEKYNSNALVNWLKSGIRIYLGNDPEKFVLDF